ncbi:oxygen-independent coproporphyrinogen III oxidase [Niveispirillum irakense]|uniref:oxygen-independent coproporphyrinogen III oxidase n=1 Tax=Niveispirillum irakense TaxID=34011 RepID=UPI0004070038|nr:oxygen-independent coproporphyrinogen III oxidase [Niveispirillum irakense]
MHPDLVAKYRHQRVPRYTSYPASPHFSPTVTASTYRGWLEKLDPASSLSLYLHVPFCRSMCWYCGCHTTVVRHADPVWDYVAALSSEIRHVAGLLPKGPVVRHIHFGGGTPTLMPPQALRGLMAELRSRFTIAPDAELAIEIDPRTLTAEMTTALGDTGFTRASLGVQSFDPVVQAAINRIQPVEMTALAIDGLRRAGIHAINLDLLYGLPMQTVESCVRTVETALNLSPDRLSIFGYAHMPGFKAHQSRINEAELPDADARIAQNAAIEETLLAAGYVRIGLDHFAKPDDPIALAAGNGGLRRNFQGYTTDDADALLGFGASAIGRVPQGYVANVLQVPAYMKAVEEFGVATARGYRMTLDDRLRATLIERLMCHFSVDMAEMAGQFDVTTDSIMPAEPALAALIADGVVELHGTRLVVPDPARPLVRSVAALFDAHLDPEGGRHSKAI